MKVLFIIHGIDDKAIETAHRKKQFISKQLECEIDSCVWGERKEIENLHLELLGGKVYLLPTITYAIDPVVQLVDNLIKGEKYTSVIVADGCRSGDLAIRLANLLGTQCVTGAIEISMNNENVFCKKMVYNSIASATYCLPKKYVISEKFSLKNVSEYQEETLEKIELETCNRPSYVLEDVVIEKRRKQIVSPILIAAGMGIQSKEEITALRKYARECGFSFGVSRPVAMRGWADISEIIGVSGETYTPKIAVVIGISGAAAFMAGIEQSEYILAVNSNPDAKIVSLSDAVIVNEYQNVLSDLLEYMKRWKK